MFNPVLFYILLCKRAQKYDSTNRLLLFYHVDPKLEIRVLRLTIQAVTLHFNYRINLGVALTQSSSNFKNNSS